MKAKITMVNNTFHEIALRTQDGGEADALPIGQFWSTVHTGRPLPLRAVEGDAGHWIMPDQIVDFELVEDD